MGLKKYLVLGILFILPITVYLFFASGVNQFAKLPKLGDADVVLTGFLDSEGSALSTKDKITILGFFGGKPLLRGCHSSLVRSSSGRSSSGRSGSGRSGSGRSGSGRSGSGRSGSGRHFIHGIWTLSSQE